MKAGNGGFSVFLCLAVILFLACGGQAETATAEAETDVKQEQAAEPAKAATPEELGAAIGTVYVEAMQKVIELGKDHPPVEDIKPKLTELKDKCIAELVDLGKIKEGMTDEDKAKVNSALRTKMREFGRDMFAQYGEASNFYMDKDKETFDLLSSFNVITQYADFDLLKKQEPEEAARLGIE